MYHFIQAQSQHYPVQVLCQTLQVSRSGYYQWLKPTSGAGSVGDNTPDQTRQIKELFALHRRRYGTRRLVLAMKDRGISVSGPPLWSLFYT